jgi:multiple sugar transport system permease protein
MSIKGSRQKWGYIFVLPGIVWYGLFMAYPMYYAIDLSVHRWMGAQATSLFVGLGNFRAIFTDPLFGKSFINTFYFTLMSVCLTTFSALFIAILLTLVTRFRGIYRTLYFLPSVCGVVAVGIIWTWLYQPSFGLFNHILEFLHLPLLRWINDERMALFCVALTQAWMRLGFNVVIFLAGLLSIPKQFYDAAEVDGASRFRQIIHITLPLAMPIITFLLIYNTIYGLTVFGEVYMMTRGGPGDATYSVAYLMYETAFRYSEMGKGSAIAFILFVVILGITIIQMKFFERKTKIEY